MAKKSVQQELVKIQRDLRLPKGDEIFPSLDRNEGLEPDYDFSIAQIVRAIASLPPYRLELLKRAIGQKLSDEQKGAFWGTETTPEPYPSIEKAILDLLSKGECKYTVIRDILGRRETQISVCLKNLTDTGQIERESRTDNIYFRIKNNA